MTNSRELTIKVSARDRMDSDLNAAVAVLRTQAMQNQDRRGVLVTRRSADSFSIALTDQVPFGMTRERQDW